MYNLPEKYLEYIRKDLESNGLIYENLENEIVDHVATLVENKMQNGRRFIDAYREALTEFGGERQIRNIQKETIQFENYRTKIMLQNYLKIAYRNIAKHKFYSLINVAGLAIGFACCILILLYVKDETSYDKHFPNYERIYRVVSDHQFNNNPFHASVTPAPLSSALASDYPEVELSTRIRNGGSIVFKMENEAIKEPGFAYVDSTFLKVFQLPVIEGNPNTALAEPNSLVITQSIAKKYFSEGPYLGKSLETSGGTHLVVTAVIEDIPENTHFSMPIFISMTNWSRANNNNWMSNNFHTYVLLREGSSQTDLESKFPEMINKYIGPQVMELIGVTLKQARENGHSVSFYMQPIHSIHLESDLQVELDPNGDITYVYIFTSIAIFILIIACINFMNMSTARSASRAKEVGIRKVLGSFRSHLIRQFLMESLLLSAAAGVLAIGLAFISIPFFNDLADKNLTIPFANPLFILLFVTGIFVLGITAGFYPSLFLSAFRPAQVLKGVFRSGKGSAALRSILVVFQFIVSVVLILGTLVIYNQLNYIRNKKLGYEKDQVLVIRNAYLLRNQLDSYKNSLLAETSVNNVAISGYLPAGGPRSDNTYFPKGTVEMDKGVNMQIWSVDEDYIPTFKMEMVAGRNFSKEFPTDNSAVILNERAAEAFGFENPIGQFISEFYWDPATGSVNQDSLIHHEIVGIVKDFHFSSLRNTISPLAFRLAISAGSLSIAFNSAAASQIVDLAQEKWSSMAPGQPFEFYFLDDRFNSIYSTEQKTGKIFATFAGLAIFVACLGLFALSSYTAEQRTKEIGVRKVLGASDGTIIFLLSKEFGRLVIIAFVIAIPIAIYGMNIWLSQFAYKATPGVVTFVTAGFIALFVSFITMSFQSIRAAKANPVDSLRSE